MKRNQANKDNVWVFTPEQRAVLAQLKGGATPIGHLAQKRLRKLSASIVRATVEPFRQFLG
jgi:hypothetical protein